MNEQDRQFIEALFTRQGDEFRQELKATSESFRQELQATSESFRQELQATTEEYKQHVSSAIEIVGHQISLLAEGHHAVLDKLEGLEERFDKLEARVEGIGTEIAAHRADTEAHHGIYRVKES
ncbi:hypothetical protein M1B72_07885 [Geomonas paludis]|uniref:Uncharacterized protein n=1 Tax=Geomonas paludis TaxID=2740185 RepID=A0A6V8MUV5_9BACT|nr:hypothetical protein [Geomonas paludis]UPU37617.1 hypothetical protein M1B72_07885 [Geomonas paludis]GFO63852.1 hypothetical protein GMPD_17710 [Geomonas paludis]